MAVRLLEIPALLIEEALDLELEAGEVVADEVCFELANDGGPEADRAV